MRTLAQFGPGFVDDMGLKPSPKHEIDRIDNDGHYEPGNCQSGQLTQNDRNRRNNLTGSTSTGEMPGPAEWCTSSKCAA